MKLTKRMKNAIIQGIVANIIFLLILIGGIIFFTFPNITDLEIKKADLNKMYQNLENIKISGLDYNELKKEIVTQELNSDVYVRTLMRNIDNQFYSKNFTNTGGEDYISFLGEIEKKIFTEKTSDEYIKKDNTLASILPTYSKDNVDVELGLSDFHFINYIEKIIYSFNLAANGEIGIGNIENIEEKGAKVNNSEVEGEIIPESDLQENIFKIPLSFDVTGQKTDIVDFLHFFESVGSIEIKGSNISVHSDRFISKVLEGDTKSTTYNIYEHQFADIESVKISDYPDSSAIPDEDKTLISIMKGEQAREKYSLSVELSFYVAGVPGYKMEKYIQDFLENFDILARKISKDARNYTTQAYKFTEGTQLQALQGLQSLDALMLSLQQDLANLRMSLATKEDIEKIYNDTVKHMEQLKRIEANYNDQIEELIKKI